MSKKSSASKESSKGNTPPKTSKSSKSVTAEEPDEELMHNMLLDAKENIVDEMGNADEQPDVIDEQPEQTWFNTLVSAGKYPLTFDKLMATPIDLSKFAKNHLKLDKITKADLVGPVYNLLKGTFQSSIELEYNMEECYKAISDQHDWTNPKGDRCPFDLSKPLPLKGHPERKYTTSVTKMKAARYESQLNRFSKHDVYSPLKILSVDMLLLVVHHKLFHLDGDVIVDLAVALHLIDKRLLERQIIRNLERLVGARELEIDYRMMQRTNIRVILHSIHNDDGNSTSANIKQALRTLSTSASACDTEHYNVTPSSDSYTL
ncbi:hypothetical protein Tco_1011134, partial [Tanacetum coccineum]